MSYCISDLGSSRRKPPVDVERQCHQDDDHGAHQHHSQYNTSQNTEEEEEEENTWWRWEGRERKAVHEMQQNEL